ncbi:MAG: bifunctional ADP-heptose synthase [Bacteroidota bacterium]
MAKKSRNIEEIIQSFQKLNVLIIGDVMIDAYLWGKVNRISPEAPVPIVAITKKENRLGGAANVAINVQALGATPVLCSVIGNDLDGRTFIELLQKQNMSTEGILQSTSRTTTVKTRVIGNNHQMLRVDEETEEEINLQDRKQLLDRISSMLKSRKIDVIIFEDYDKGVIGKFLIGEVVKLAHQKNIPVTADPKKKNFNHYRNISLLKPNMKELREGMKIDLDKGNINEISRAIRQLAEENQLETILVTLSEKGAYVYNRKESQYLPAHVRNIADVSGAGDTVISVAALSLASGASPITAAILSNFAGGIVCEKVGVVPIEKLQLLKEIKAAKLF